MSYSGVPFYCHPDLQRLPTPFYVYDLDGMRERVQAFQKSLPKNSHVHFAMKSNNNLSVLKLMRSLGVGVDLVSSGEMKRAQETGFTGEQMIFSGVGKTAAEIAAALKLGVWQLNVESLPELERIAEIAGQMKMRARVALRMNPDVDVNTHPYIRTGFRENKFGLDFSEISRAIEILHIRRDQLDLQGLTLHIGSQIRDTAPFRDAIRKTVQLWLELKRQGFAMRALDVGGGLGIDYLNGDLNQDEATITEYGRVVQSEIGESTPAKIDRLDFEPGRILVARFGALITEVQYIKRTPFKNFVIVDTGMNHLMRPALYEAHHRIVSFMAGLNVATDKAAAEAGAAIMVADVVGPICESADVLGAERVLPANLKPGDRLAILDTGAYGYVMASDYNMRERPKEYAIERGHVIG